MGVVSVNTVVISEAAMYKFAFRSNKPDADAFTNWVASDVLSAIRKTGSYTAARRAKYERQGKQLEWIDNREEGIEARKGFTDTLKDHGVTPPSPRTRSLNSAPAPATAAPTRSTAMTPTHSGIRSSNSRPSARS